MKRPAVTVVVPALDEERSIAACLESLRAQSFPGQIEIIVVDNGSRDRTVAIAEQFGARVIRERRKGVCFARQAGTRAAGAQLIANLDADSRAASDWLERLLAPFATDPRLVAVAGPVTYEGAPAWARAHAASFALVNSIAARLTGGTAFVMASNLAFRRVAFDRVGGYDLTLPSIGDEADFLFNLRRIGRVGFEPSAHVTTSARRFKRGPLHFVVVEVGYQTVFAYFLGKRFHRAPRRARADIREGERT